MQLEGSSRMRGKASHLTVFLHLSDGVINANCTHVSFPLLCVNL